jgi:hypothetical protein
MAFARGPKMRSGLDDGRDDIKQNKTTPRARDKNEQPKILPGETLRDFSVRVNASLPLLGHGNRQAPPGKDPLGIKVYRTKKERKMHKLYDQWREEDRKIKEQREEAMETLAEQELDNDNLQNSDAQSNFLSLAAPSQGKKKGKKGRQDDDPWLELQKKRGEAKIGLREVALAPPQLAKISGKEIKVRGAVVVVDNVPKSSGSLRRREELQDIRSSVVAAYRTAKGYQPLRLEQNIT